MNLAKYRDRPFGWWVQTPIYAARIAKAHWHRAQTERDAGRAVIRAFFRRQRGGVFVEVGAARPDFMSIGSRFRALGWRVISIEPNPAFAQLHRDAGHEIYQYACGERDESNAAFSIVHAPDGAPVSNESFSSLSVKPAYAALSPVALQIETIRVEVRRLDSLLATHAPEVERVDCLAIDTEGWEIEVLKGFDLERFSPRVLIIENLLDDENYRRYLAGRGYRLWKTLRPNEIYVRCSH